MIKSFGEISRLSLQYALVNQHIQHVLLVFPMFSELTCARISLKLVNEYARELKDRLHIGVTFLFYIFISYMDTVFHLTSICQLYVQEFFCIFCSRKKTTFVIRAVSFF